MDYSIDFSFLSEDDYYPGITEESVGGAIQYVGLILPTSADSRFVDEYNNSARLKLWKLAVQRELCYDDSIKKIASRMECGRRQWLEAFLDTLIYLSVDS